MRRVFQDAQFAKAPESFIIHTSVGICIPAVQNSCLKIKPLPEVSKALCPEP